MILVYIFIEPIAFYISDKYRKYYCRFKVPKIRMWTMIWEQIVIKARGLNQQDCCLRKRKITNGNEKYKFSNEKWEITRRGFYKNNKPDWKWEAYNNWEVDRLQNIYKQYIRMRLLFVLEKADNTYHEKKYENE